MKKKCAKCKEPKSTDNFSKHTRSKDGLNSECRSCRKLRADEYYATHFEQAKARVKKWQHANPEKPRMYCKTYKKNNPERMRVICGNRKARVRRANGRIALKEWILILEKYGNKCIYPGCSETKVERDHVLPLASGGDNTVDNVQPLCRHHNSSKGTKYIDYRIFYGGE